MHSTSCQSKHPPIVLQQSQTSFDIQIATSQDETLITLKKHGYAKIKKIHDTSQGELIKAVKINDGTYVAIKTINKKLHKEKIIKDADGICISTNKNILKEALILKVLTSLNVPVVDYICKYIEMFEDNLNIYLVSEYISGDMNLTKFIKTVHQYIKSGKLSIKHWKTISKYIHWEIAVCIHWLHLNMSCCHLDLITDNILITNCNFIKDNNGSISIDKNIGIKICDFGVSEIFESRTNLNCDKIELTGNYQFKSPQIFNDQVYNGKLSDVWSLGIILYKMCIGYDPYEYANATYDASYHSIKNNHIYLFIQQNNLNCFFNSKIISILSGMLSYNEDKRFSTKDILKHSLYKSYYTKYNKHFKFNEIKPEYNIPALNLVSFPYYSIHFK